jgi:hypothetical protein
VHPKLFDLLTAWTAPGSPGALAVPARPTSPGAC